ncbi:MAG: hypothetical protein PHP64_08925, partial [Actinomycetota bacterium]|nr:hypothetical protein [Actinomycetota bacterium]
MKKSVKSVSLVLSFILLISLLPLLLSPQRAGAAPSSEPDLSTWVTDGPVYAIASTPTTTYIGGEFTYVGPNTGRGVSIDINTGEPLSTYPRVEGDVYASCPDDSGGFYIGGDFTKVGDLTRNRIAHILSNGTVDPDWNPNANDTVSTLSISGGTVYAGGDFTSIGAQSPQPTRNYIAAIDAGTGNATDWNPNANDDVETLSISGGTIYAGGDFTS